MKRTTVNFIRKIAAASLILFFVFANAGWAKAADEVPVGAQGAVGVQGPVGAQGETGAQGSVGVQEQTGPTEPVGVQPSSPPTSQAEPTAPATNAGTQNNNPQNVQTGSDSSNTNQNSSANSSSVSVEDQAATNNQVGVDLNTGNNNIGQNTVAGNLTTGGIDGAVNLINVSNSQFAPGSSVASQLIDPNSGQITLIPSTDRISLFNTNTGPSSENLNTANNPNIISVFDLNSAAMNNGIEINANTGLNTISSNTKAGNMTTGDINLGLNLVNIANVLMPNTLLSMDIFNITGAYNGDLIMPELANVQTGPNSSNENLLSNTNQLGINITNNADISNDLAMNTNTGGNRIGNNTASGGMETGESTVKSALTNLANIAATPIVYLINVFGHWAGSLLGLDPSQVIVNEVNSTTGPDSSNINSQSSNDQTNINIENNADVNNKIRVNANTGGNTIKDNTVAGRLKTGDINLSANVVNILNSYSQKVGRFALRIINIFGDWNGNASATVPVSSAGGGSSKTKKILPPQNSTGDTNVVETDTDHPGGVRVSYRSVLSANSNVSGSTDPAGITGPSDPVGPASNVSVQSNQSRNIPWGLIIIIGASFLVFSWILLEVITLRYKTKKSAIH